MNIHPHLRYIFAVLIILGFATPVQADSFGDPIGPGLFRLAGNDPSLPGDDLEPFKKIVGNADFVGLGEPFHTTGGVYVMKHRLFRYLVEEMGFRVLGMESPFIWGEQVEQYVQTCQGSPADALRGGVFTVFQSTETADLMQWMCEWNQAHPGDRVHFYSFDIQRTPRQYADRLIAFLLRLGWSEDDPRIVGVRACDGVVDSFWPSQPFPQARYDQCQGALSEIAGYFDQNENLIEQQASREDLGWARVALVGERAWQEQLFFQRTDFPRAYTARDAGMAYLVQAIRELRFPQARVALWAHNGHVATNGVNYVFDDEIGGTTIMGDFLKRDLGHKYVIIGIIALQTGLDWSALGLCGFYDIRGPNPLENVLHDAGQGDTLLLDFDPSGHGNGNDAFLDPTATYSMGGSRLVNPRETFDAMVYLEVSPPMHPLAWPACQ
jgi:erythromycin esterase-like protein